MNFWTANTRSVVAVCERCTSGTGVEWKKIVSLGIWIFLGDNDNDNKFNVCYAILSWNRRPFLPFVVAHSARGITCYFCMLQMCDWARLKYIELETATTAPMATATPDLLPLLKTFERRTRFQHDIKCAPCLFGHIFRVQCTLNVLEMIVNVYVTLLSCCFWSFVYSQALYYCDWFAWCVFLCVYVWFYF